MSDTPKRKRGRERERPGPYRWAVQVFFLAIVLSAALSLASETSLSGAGAAAAALVLAVFCGIVSGTTTAVIVVRLQTAFALPESVLLSVAVTALVSGLTIGGKALGKTVALNKSTSVVYWVGRFLHLFHR